MEGEKNRKIDRRMGRRSMRLSIFRQFSPPPLDARANRVIANRIEVMIDVAHKILLNESPIKNVLIKTHHCEGLVIFRTRNNLILFLLCINDFANL